MNDPVPPPSVRDPRRRNIALLIPSLSGGGAEFVARNWACELASRGWNVDILHWANSGDLSSRDRDALNDAGVQLIDLVPEGATGGRKAPYRQVVRRFASYARASRPVAVVSLLMVANLVSLAARLHPRARYATVTSTHDIPSASSFTGHFALRVQHWLSRLLLRRSNATIAVSHSSAANVLGAFRVPHHTVHVVPNPVWRDAGAEPAKGTQATVAVARPALALAFVGRLVPVKQPELFLHTIRELVDRGHDARGVVVGDGPLRGELERMAARLSISVEFIGWRDDWAQRYSAVSCVVSTSLVEGFGNVLVEAARHRIPTVACSQALGVADAIVPGVTGELALHSSAASFANAILRLGASNVEDPVDRWLQRFTVGSSVDALEEVLFNAVETPGR